MPNRMKSVVLASMMLAALPVAAASKPIRVASVGNMAGSHGPIEGSYTLAPMGFIRFCMENAADCAFSASERTELTAQRLAQLQNVNLSVNRRIAPKNDAPGQDIWSLNISAGDCDDYVVQKRHELIALGWPQGNMLFAAVETPRGENHLILIVRTDRGDLVLDNLTTALRSVAEAPYTWIKRQTPADPWQWEKA